MRWLAILALALTVATEARAAVPARPPHIPRGTHYRVVRAHLIQAGFEPVPVLSYGPRCRGRGLACLPERISCDGQLPVCRWLFARRSDNALFIVFTGNPHAGPPLLDYGFFAIDRADRDSLEDLVVVLPNGKRHKFEWPRPPSKQEWIPLCSQNGGRIPCWVKPPADYRLSKP